MPMLAEVNTSCPRQVERLGQLALDAVRHPGRVAGVADVVHQDRELVAAEPRHRVAGPHAPLDAPGDGPEQLVADAVAEAVVDDLEPVEVDEQHREAVLGAPLGAAEGAAEQVGEQRAVGEAGQGVVEGVVEQLLLRQLALGDVGERPRHPVRLPGLVAHRHAAAQHPAIAAVLVQDAVLDLELRGHPLHVRVDLRLEPRRRPPGARASATRPATCRPRPRRTPASPSSASSSRPRWCGGASPTARRWRRAPPARSAPRSRAAPAPGAAAPSCRAPRPGSPSGRGT